MNEENTPFNEKSKTSMQSEQQKEALLDVTTIPIVKNGGDEKETSVLDEQWAAMRQDWQAQPVPKTDINVLLKQTKRRTLWAKTFLGLNVLFTIAVFIAFLIGLYDGEYGTPMNTYLGIASFGTAIFVYYEIKIRLQTWRQCCDSPDKAVDNAILACQSSIKYMILNKLSCIPFAITGNWFLVVMAEENDKSPLKGLLFINILLIVVYVVADKLHKKRKKEYQRLMSLK
ncbi:MAG: hypothetical protein HRT52_13785 [Colwellia sp.]|nr:hypothetical protein [Colwellia sp.]